MTFHYKWWGLIFVLPAVGFFAIFNLFPTLFGLYLAFTDYDLLSPPIWVGLDNFVNLWGDRLFRQAFGNTLAALVFDQAFRGRDWLKAAFFLPVLAPVTVVAVVWRVLLHPNGVLTSLTGGWWGVTEIRWLADSMLAPFTMISVHDWAVIPFFMMIWLAGLAAIPPEYREAAAIDGAGPVRTFWHVDLPQLRSTAVLVASLSSIGAFQTFALQYVLPNDAGGPANSTMVLALLVLKYGFQYFRMGDAAAISVVMFGMIMTVTLAQLWFNRRA
jgi:multiple sugar transport system permease protein